MNDGTEKKTAEEAPKNAPDEETEQVEQAAENSDAKDAASKSDSAEPASEAARMDAVDDDEPDLAAELADAKDKMLRAMAEAENVRRRAARDVDNANKRAISGFAREMIVIADNLGRALSAVDEKAVDGNEALKGLLTGVEMTAREMQNAFERSGITKVDPMGEKFDPQLHEAMFEYEDPSMPAGSIGQVMEVGYSLHGQPIRPAKVGVTKGGPKEAAGPAPTPSGQTMKEAEASSGQGGKAYEDQGSPSGTNLDEEL